MVELKQKKKKTKQKTHASKFSISVSHLIGKKDDSAGYLCEEQTRERFRRKAKLYIGVNILTSVRTKTFDG